MLSKFCFTGEPHIKLSGIMAEDAPSAACSTGEQSLLQTQPDSLDFFPQTRATHIAALQRCPAPSPCINHPGSQCMHTGEHAERGLCCCSLLHCEKWVRAASPSRQPGIVSSGEARCLQVQAVQLRTTPSELHQTLSVPLPS